jgi:hypothetical protein
MSQVWANASYSMTEPRLMDEYAAAEVLFKSAEFEAPSFSEPDPSWGIAPSVSVGKGGAPQCQVLQQILEAIKGGKGGGGGGEGDAGVVPYAGQTGPPASDESIWQYCDSDCEGCDSCMNKWIGRADRAEVQAPSTPGGMSAWRRGGEASSTSGAADPIGGALDVS